MKFDRIVEGQIRRAMEAGEFSNLPGSGKPIEWPARNPYAGEWQLAFDLLSEAGMAPRWIELEADIRRQAEAARDLLQQACQRWGDRAPACKAACARFTERIRRINHSIRLRNLLAPAGAKGIAEIRAAVEIERISRKAARH